MKRDPLPAHVLATRIIPNVAPDMAKELGLTPDQKSLAIVTADSDDVTYTALDEATKKADCKVVYAKSFYAGAANANTKLAGEIIGILAAPNPAEAKAGLEAGVDTIEHGAELDDELIALFKTNGVGRASSLTCTVSPALPFVELAPEKTKSTEVQKVNGRIVFEGIVQLSLIHI